MASYSFFSLMAVGGQRKCPSVPVDISTLIKTPIVTCSLFTLLALSVTLAMMTSTMF